MTVLPRTARQRPLSLTTCDSCLTPVVHLPLTHRAGNPTTLCPPCASRVALEDAAGEHLHSLIYPTILAWARHWKGAGVGDGALGALLSLEGRCWHPDGALYRDTDDAQISARAIIDEALNGD